jgi:hypothetical protein
MEEAVLMKGLNISVTYPHSNMDMTCAVESIVSKLPETLGIEFQWKIRCMLEKSKSSRPNMTTKELKAIRCLRLKKDIKILQADKGSCTVVLDESKYKLNTLLESGVYEPLSKDPRATVEGKV